MSHSPQQKTGSKAYQDGWRAINLLIRSDGSWSGRERNTCYLNLGGGRFEDHSFVSGLDLPSDGRAFVAMDLDGDGDLDLVLKNRTGPQLRVLRNESTETPRALLIRLQGKGANREGIGARLWLKTNERTLMREIASGSGFLSQGPRAAHFGLRADEQIQQLRIRWPGGHEEAYSPAPDSAGQWRVTEGAGLTRVSPRVTPAPTSEPEIEPTGEGTWLAEPAPAPEFTLTGLNGPIALENSRGKWTLLNFWATWCPPCRAEMTELAEWQDRFAAAGVGIIAISVDEPDQRDAVRAFTTERGVTFPVAYADDDTVNAYTILNRLLFDRQRDLAIPTSFLIDEGGFVRKVYRGPASAALILADAQKPSATALPFPGRWIRSGPRRDFSALGAAFAERDLAAPALAMFRTAAARGDASQGLTNNLAGALAKSGDTDGAEAMLRQALAEKPNQPDLAVNLAGFLLASGGADQAVALLNGAVAAQPDDAEAWNLLGSALFLIGDATKAEAAYRQALALDASLAEAQDNLGSLLASTGRTREAIEAYERARALGADSVKLHSNLGILYAQTGSPARARGSLERAVAAGPQDYGAHLNLALFYLQSGNWTQAKKWATTAQTLNAESPEAYLVEAQALLGAGRREEARSKLNQILTRFPGQPQALELQTTIE